MSDEELYPERCWVYVLVDPRDHEVRYVGTTNRPRRRLNDHRTHPSSQGVLGWVQDLREEDLKPLMEVLQRIPADDRREREQLWIARFYRWGADLLNADAETTTKVVARRRDWEWSP